MRTTLTIDDRALAAARSRAQQRGITVGEALSQLAMIGYETESAAPESPSGFPVLPAVEGHLITFEMVEDALADD